MGARSYLAERNGAIQDAAIVETIAGMHQDAAIVETIAGMHQDAAIVETIAGIVLGRRGSSRNR